MYIHHWLKYEIFCIDGCRDRAQRSSENIIVPLLGLLTVETNVVDIKHEHQILMHGFTCCKGPLAMEACSAAGACFDESWPTINFFLEKNFFFRKFFFFQKNQVRVCRVNWIYYFVKTTVQTGWYGVVDIKIKCKRAK